MGGRPIGNLGNIYRTLGKINQAFDYHQQCLRLAETVGDRVLVMKTLNSLGNDAFFVGDMHQASEFYQQALDLAQEMREQ
ncbi:tetratricopeptide repeat protein [Nostoc mirabile]|uniref:tetratricopeptide repeat protein n=1 Tax=Nostoc mirabile TaxID=2907820 RepID=UPI001E4514CF|nr:tetratricopeptide repeat protein [Nostoc mirabile]